jgi:AhpD family alkylhydroperoxidase
MRLSVCIMVFATQHNLQGGTKQMTTKLQVFDPPMCCSTGVCGPSPDPALPQFASDLQWLAKEGIAVDRFNLAQQPQAFASNELVKTALTQYGNDCLPLILVNGAIVNRGSYPTRKELATLAGLSNEKAPSLYTESVAELVAIGASIASNCEPCFKFHFDKASKLGVSVEDMARAADTAQAVKENPARSVLALANRLLHRDKTPTGLPVTQSSCCTPATTAPSTKSESCCG